MRNCVKKLYNPRALKHYQLLGCGSTRNAYDMGNGMVVKLIHKGTFPKGALTKEYNSSNIEELIDALVANPKISSCQVGSMLYCLEQVFSEWNVWNQATEEEKISLAPIIEMGYDKHFIPYTVMEKADGILQEIALGQISVGKDSYDYVHISAQCQCYDNNLCLVADASLEVPVEICELCDMWVESHRTYFDEDCDDSLIIDNFLAKGEFKFDSNAAEALCRKYGIDDVFNNSTNLGVFDDRIKIVDYGYINGSRNYNRSYQRKLDEKYKQQRLMAI